MKRLAIFAVFLLPSFFFASDSFATIIDIISQEYTITGSGCIVCPEFDEFGQCIGTTFKLETSYDITSYTTVSFDTGVVFYEDEYCAGSYSIATTADGGITEDSAWVHVYGNVDDEGCGTAYGVGSAVITFQPYVSTVELITNPTGLGSLSIVDLTSGDALLEIIEYCYGDYIPAFLSLDPSHTYAMGIYNCDMWWGGDMSLEIRSVPEPATMLLLGASLVSLFGVRRKLKK